MNNLEAGGIGSFEPKRRPKSPERTWAEMEPSPENPNDAENEKVEGSMDFVMGLKELGLAERVNIAREKALELSPEKKMERLLSKTAAELVAKYLPKVIEHLPELAKQILAQEGNRKKEVADKTVDQMQTELGGELKKQEQATTEGEKQVFDNKITRLFAGAMERLISNTIDGISAFDRHKKMSFRERVQRITRMTGIGGPVGPAALGLMERHLPKIVKYLPELIDELSSEKQDGSTVDPDRSRLIEKIGLEIMQEELGMLLKEQRKPAPEEKKRTVENKITKKLTEMAVKFALNSLLKRM